MLDTSSPVHSQSIGQDSFQRLSELILTRKQTDPFAPVTVVALSRYAGVMLRQGLAANHGLMFLPL